MNPTMDIDGKSVETALGDGAEVKIERRNNDDTAQSRKILFIIVPCYNEEEILKDSASKLKQILDGLKESNDCYAIAQSSRILLIDDGSTDRTWQIIHSLSSAEPSDFSGIRLSRNYGHQYALLAGLMYSRNSADFTITIDADLQQDPTMIATFVKRYYEGYDVVYGVRNSRNTDGHFKKITANAFYRVMKFLGCHIIKNHADYRMMSSKVINALHEFEETNLFLRGLIPSMGFNSCTEHFDVLEQKGRKSKYSLYKMVTLAVDGITSFSIRPVTIIMILGFIVFLIAIVLIIVDLISYLRGNTISGWASLSISIWALSGLQLLAIGCIGEYIGKSYMEAKHRPRYLIDQIANDIRTEGESSNEHA